MPPAAIAASEAWTRREPRRAEAWFCLAGAYAPLVQWRVLRGERLAAARDGSQIKDALERALALDPTLADAYFGIGLYHYYAAVAPAAAKILRWLLFLPGGDRVAGLREMARARARGGARAARPDRARALAIYRDAARIAGGDPRARDQATRAIKRLAPPSDLRSTVFDFFSTLCLTSEVSEP